MALSRLRLRLAAGFAIAFGIALSLLAVAALGYLWYESRARLDSRLADVARGVADAVEREALETRDTTLRVAISEVLREWPRTGDHWLVADDAGTLLVSTDSAASRSDPASSGKLWRYFFSLGNASLKFSPVIQPAFIRL